MNLFYEPLLETHKEGQKQFFYLINEKNFLEFFYTAGHRIL